MNDKTELRRVIGLFSCTMLVVGNMIGTGIFTTPGRVAQQLPTSGWILAAWVIGGFLALCGALSYAELGASFPKAGGNYVFLREAYGPLWGFLYGWAAALITQSGTIAILAVGFTNYAGIETPWKAQTTAAGMIIFFGLLNYLGVKIGSGVVNAITSLKIVAILGLIFAGLFIGKGSFANAQPFWPDQTSPSLAGGLAMALIPIMYTYSGWNATVYVGGEVIKPSRTIPLSLLLGVGITGTLYLALNALYIYAVPVDQMRGVVASAAVAARELFSPRAALMIASLIAFSKLGCLDATLLTAPRIPFAMAQDGYFFKAIREIHPRFQTPGNAILFVTFWGAILAIWGAAAPKYFFMLLDDYVTVPSLLMNALTVSAIFMLRRTRPDLERPYRAWGYPVLPIFFITTVLWMVGSEIYHDWKAALAGIAMVAAGVPFYYYFKKSQEAR